MLSKGKLFGGIIVFLTLLYPLAVYFGIHYLEPRAIAILLAILLLLRLMTLQTGQKWNQQLILVGILYCGFAVWHNNLVTLRFYPALINLGFFIVFVSSLFSPPPIIERLARLQHPDLPKKGIRYTRKVTQVWCVFFLINGSIAVATAIWCSFSCWSLYNGLIAYLLMGLLMGVEYLVRIRSQVHAR